MLKLSHHVTSPHIQDFLEDFFMFSNINEVFSGEQEKESLIHMKMGYKNPSLVITVCRHSASLVMPISDPLDGFFYPTLTLMMDSYNLLVEMEDRGLHFFYLILYLLLYFAYTNGINRALILECVFENYFSYFSTKAHFMCTQKRQFFWAPKHMFNPFIHNNAVWRLWNIMHLTILWKMEHFLQKMNKCSIFHNIFKSI